MHHLRSSVLLAAVFATFGCGSADRALRSGGSAGGGGSGGRGGAAAAGAGGSKGGGDAGSDAGVTADGAESCQQLMDDYARALVPAFACTVGAPNQCQQRSLSLDCTICSLLAQNTTTLDELRAQMLLQGCITPGDCSCVSAGTPMCVPVDAGSSNGTCR